MFNISYMNYAIGDCLELLQIILYLLHILTCKTIKVWINISYTTNILINLKALEKVH